MGRTPAGQTREKIYRFMRERLAAGRSPTVREVQERFGFRAVQSAREHLERLVEDGRLVKRPGEARGYRLPGRKTVLSMVPILGRVPAGPVDLATEDLEGYVPFEGGHEAGERFGLHVKGDSMRDAGILDGDLVIVRKQDHADDRAIVVALVGEEATVKTLRLFGRGKNRRLELHPANPAYAPIVPDAGEDSMPFSILGKVVEIRRTL